MSLSIHSSLTGRYFSWRRSGTVGRFRASSDTATNGSPETTATDRQPSTCGRQYTEGHPGCSSVYEAPLSRRGDGHRRRRFRCTRKQHAHGSRWMQRHFCNRKCVIDVRVAVVWSWRRVSTRMSLHH